MRILPDCVRVKRAQTRLVELSQAARGGDAAARERLTLSLRSTFAHWRPADTWRLRDQVLRELNLHADDRVAALRAPGGLTPDEERFFHAGAEADPTEEEDPEQAEQPDPEQPDPEQRERE